MKRNKLYVVALAAPLLLGLSACAPAATVDDYAGVTATLDKASGQIDLPVEAFALSDEEVRIVDSANDALLDGCLRAAGFTFPAAQYDRTQASTLPERRWGLWVDIDAENGGYDLNETVEWAEALAAEEEALTDEWWQAYDRCFDQVELLPVMMVNGSSEPTVVDIGMNDSYAYVLASDLYAEVRDEWVDCITSQGLSPMGSDESLVPEVPESPEDQIRAASIDVGCKDSIDLVQRLADVEAQWQSAYLENNESALIAYRDEVDETLDQARQLLATNAG